MVLVSNKDDKVKPDKDCYDLNVEGYGPHPSQGMPTSHASLARCAEALALDSSSLTSRAACLATCLLLAACCGW